MLISIYRKYFERPWSHGMAMKTWRHERIILCICDLQVSFGQIMLSSPQQIFPIRRCLIPTSIWRQKSNYNKYYHIDGIPTQDFKLSSISRISLLPDQITVNKLMVLFKQWENQSAQRKEAPVVRSMRRQQSHHCSKRRNNMAFFLFLKFITIVQLINSHLFEAQF